MLKQNVIDSLAESIPYLIGFKEQIFVIKVGGEIINDKCFDNILEQIIFLKKLGIFPVVVHGGGNEISHYMQKMSCDYQFINGIRITNDESMEIVQMVLCGKINKDIVAKVISKGESAIGISGIDGGIVRAKKILNEKGVEFCRVGEIEEVKAELIKDIIKKFIPVISPVGINKHGQSLNINADTTAVEIAIALQAKKLLFITPVNGVLKDIEDKESVISIIKINQISAMIANKSVQKGMIPKLLACKKAIEKGVGKVHILGSQIKNSILLELFTKRGIGSLIC